MSQRGGKANQSLRLALGWGENWRNPTLCLLVSELSDPTQQLTVLLLAGRGWGNGVIHMTWAQSSHSCPTANHMQPGGISQRPKQHTGYRLRVLFLQGSSMDGSCFSPQRAGLQPTMPFTAWPPCLLKILNDPHHILSLSVTTSYGCLPLSHCSRLSLGSMSCDCSLLSGPQRNSVSNNRTLSRWHLAIVVQGMGNDKMSFFSTASLPHWKNHCHTKSLYWI
jgi:hypothetical protein